MSKDTVFRYSPFGGGHEQRPSGKLYTLYSGWAFRYKTLSDGRRQILNFLLPGDLIGLQQEFSEGAAMHGIEALTAIRLCVFPREGLELLFRRYPHLGYDITWLAAREEGMVDDNLLSAGRRTAAERVAMLLMHLFQRLGLHEIRNGRLWLLNPKALMQLADYYDAPLRKVPLL
jgi:CRP-like cAMP-binding protein